MNPLPCVICGRELKSIGSSAEQPDGGVSCVAYGNYGSVEQDNLIDPPLVFNICDGCFKTWRHRMRIIEQTSAGQDGANIGAK